MAHVTHYKRLPIGGLMVAIGAVLALARWGADLPFVGLEILFGVISLGLGTLLPVTTVCIQNAAPVHQPGTATASMNFFRSLGGALLVAAFGAILLAGGVVGGLHGSTPARPMRRRIPGRSPPSRHVPGRRRSLAMALVFLVAMEERPLRSRSAPWRPRPTDRRETAPETVPGAGRSLTRRAATPSLGLAGRRREPPVPLLLDVAAIGRRPDRAGLAGAIRSRAGVHARSRCGGSAAGAADAARRAVRAGTRDGPSAAALTSRSGS